MMVVFSDGQSVSYDGQTAVVGFPIQKASEFAAIGRPWISGWLVLNAYGTYAVAARTAGREVATTKEMAEDGLMMVKKRLLLWTEGWAGR